MSGRPAPRISSQDGQGWRKRAGGERGRPEAVRVAGVGGGGGRGSRFLMRHLWGRRGLPRLKRKFLIIFHFLYIYYRALPNRRGVAGDNGGLIHWSVGRGSIGDKQGASSQLSAIVEKFSFIPG